MPDLECPIFADRRLADPQGCIDDLIRQTAAQGRRIYELTGETKRLREEVAYLQKGKPGLFEDAQIPF